MVFSTLLGIIVGMLSALYLKTFNSISLNPVYESGIVLCFGISSYMISEMASLSGISTLLTCGIVMSHYTWYNLSE